MTALKVAFVAVVYYLLMRWLVLGVSDADE